MAKDYEKVMRVGKRRGDEMIYPVSLNHSLERTTYGCSYGKKLIEEHEIYVHVEGEATIYVGEQVYHPGYGTIVTYKPGELHENFITGLGSYERYVLLFHYDELTHLWDGIENSLLNMFLDRDMFSNNMIQLPPHETQRLLSLLEKGADYIESNDPQAEALFYSVFLRILAIINNGFLHAVTKQEQSMSSPIVNMALKLVENQFVELQSVDQLSRQLHISNSYLARIFKKQVGTSVYEYIQNMKLAHAVKLLGSGKSVTEACFDSGFNNYSYFIQLFKRKYGITPRKYQKSLEV